MTKYFSALGSAQPYSMPTHAAKRRIKGHKRLQKQNAVLFFSKYCNINKKHIYKTQGDTTLWKLKHSDSVTEQNTNM